MNARPLRGTPQPPGANWDGHGVNFSLFSAHAQKVELCLFDAEGRQEERVELQATGDFWHTYLPGCQPGTIYGYRVHGPYRPKDGHRFNPNKLLLDPYARALSGELHWDDSVYGYLRGDKQQDLSFDTRDSANYVPKAVVVDESYDWGKDCPPRVPWASTVIYEAHSRGFTKLHPDIDEALRGSFAALASDPVITYLQKLGVTTLELLPVHSFVDDHFLVEKNRVNYWGYNSLGFFATEARYLSSGDRNEFKDMVRRLHKSGIEVILDVVYNHTAEGGQTGPTLGFRGIDNASYYRLVPDDPRVYINDSGCGNTLNLNHPRVLQMVIDSLRHWVVDMHVDGFRFDLAVSLGRETDGFDSNGAFFKAIREDPVLSQVKLIAEPWDIGPGGYQLGGFPPGWAEWNDRYRDCLRRFWRGDPGQLPELARNLHGSSDLFEHNDRRPSASINLITSHDGFTLKDLVSYNERHNLANGEDNNDGHSANFSYNHGVEGATDDAEIISLRQRHQRNLLATLFLSHGTPMLLAGDELGRSQLGNNNAYCQDNSLTWQDWSALADESQLYQMVCRLIKLRRDHPLLHRDRFVHGEEQFESSGYSDIQWLRADGQPMADNDWHHPQVKFLALLLAAEALPARDTSVVDEKEAALVIAFNADQVTVELILPESEYHWRCLFSTADVDSSVTERGSVEIEARSVQLFELQI
ncbi:MAG: isoamylase [Planctomycetota bacterium]|jgi:isoamylase